MEAVKCLRLPTYFWSIVRVRFSGSVEFAVLRQASLRIGESKLSACRKLETNSRTRHGLCVHIKFQPRAILQSALALFSLVRPEFGSDSTRPGRRSSVTRYLHPTF